MESSNFTQYFKNISNDQYSCPECSLVPEFLRIDYNRGSLVYECPNHLEKEIALKEYFSKELTYKCDSCGKSFNQLKENKNINNIFNYCIKDKKYLCQNCSKTHEHKDSFIKISESKIKCNDHLNDLNNMYCRECKRHYCQKDTDCGHDRENIIKPSDKDIQNLVYKRDNIKKRIEIEECLIKLLDTLIETYQKYPTNYFHCINIINISTGYVNRNKKKPKEEKEKEESNQMKNTNNNNEFNEQEEEEKLKSKKNENRIESINENNNNSSKIKKQKEEMILSKLDMLEKKVLNAVKVKLGVELKGNEIVVNLNGKKIKNEEFDLLSKINFKYLEELYLSNNYISNIASLAQLNAPNLRKIDLSFNQINDVQPCKPLVINNKKISYINLKHNKINDAGIFKDSVFIDKEIILDENNLLKKEIDEIRNKIKEKEFENTGIFEYKIDKKKNKIRIFGKNFVIKNKSYCKIIIDNKQKDLTEFYKYTKNIKDETINIKIIMNQKVTSLDCMFYECTELISISEVSEWDTSEITDMSAMFSGCEKLISLPDISMWNTSNVKSMSMMFSKCKKLENLPDLSKWNISSVSNLSFMFSKCENLTSLPDLSIWNTLNVTDMSSMFSRCEKLKQLPDISKWNTSSVFNMSMMFNECCELANLPNISIWNISKVTDKSNMFSGCNKIRKKIPKKFII